MNLRTEVLMQFFRHEKYNAEGLSVWLNYGTIIIKDENTDCARTLVTPAEIANGLLTRIRFQNKPPPLHTRTQANTNEKSPIWGFFCLDRDLSSGVKLKKLHSLDLWVLSTSLSFSHRSRISCFFNSRSITRITAYDNFCLESKRYYLFSLKVSIPSTSTMFESKMQKLKRK